MFHKIKVAIASENEMDSETLRLLSLFCLLLSGMLSFFNYTHIGWLWNTSVSFSPDFISTIMAIFLIAPLYMREILKWNKSIYSSIAFILILLVFASFVQLALGGNGKNIITTSLLAAAVVLSWLGIKPIAGVAWMLVFAAGIYSAIVNSLAMGFFGFIYVASGFIGLLFHSGVNPGQLVQGIKNEYSSPVNSMLSNSKKEITATVDKIT